MVKGVDVLFNPLLVDMNYEFKLVFLAEVVAKGDHVPELPGCINMKEREGERRRVKCLARQVNKYRRVFSYGIKHDRIVKFSHHLAYYVD